MHSDCGINSSRGWWPSLQGGGTPAHGITQERGKKTVQWNLALYAERRGVTECKTAMQEEWDYLIHRVSQIFPRGQFLDESRCCCFLRGALVSPCRMLCSHTVPLLYCTAGNVWSVIFSTCHKIPMHSWLSSLQNNPCSVVFKLLLDGTQPPSNSNPVAKGTPPKIWKKRSDGGCFCVAHSLLFSLCTLVVSQWTLRQIACIIMNRNNNFLEFLQIHFWSNGTSFEVGVIFQRCKRF